MSELADCPQPIQMPIEITCLMTMGTSGTIGALGFTLAVYLINKQRMPWVFMLATTLVGFLAYLIANQAGQNFGTELCRTLFALGCVPYIISLWLSKIFYAARITELFEGVLMSKTACKANMAFTIGTCVITLLLSFTDVYTIPDITYCPNFAKQYSGWVIFGLGTLVDVVQLVIFAYAVLSASSNTNLVRVLFACTFLTFVFSLVEEIGWSGIESLAPYQFTLSMLSIYGSVYLMGFPYLLSAGKKVKKDKKSLEAASSTGGKTGKSVSVQSAPQQ